MERFKYFRQRYIKNNWYNNRNSYRECSVKNVALRNFAKFTGKHLCQSLFFDKVAGLKPATLLKRDSCFSVFLSILRNFQEHVFYRIPTGDGFCNKLGELSSHLHCNDSL